MRKTDDNIILEMLNDGKNQKDIAEHFGVTPAAICKRVKKITTQLPPSFQNLTHKEQRFVMGKAAGMTRTSAAFAAFDCTSRGSAKSIGSKLMKSQEIQASIQELMYDSGLSRRYRVQKLKHLIDHPDPGVAQRALESSFKLDGYVEKHVHFDISREEISDNLEEIEAEIARLKAELRGDIIEIEVDNEPASIESKMAKIEAEIASLEGKQEGVVPDVEGN